MIITRHGVPVATIQPLDVDPWAPVKVRASLPELEEPPIDWEALDLDDLQRQVLPTLDDLFQMDDVGRSGKLTPGQAALCAAHLEIKGLATKTMAGYRLTRLGRRVAGALGAED